MPRPDGSCRSSSFGGVLWSTRRQTQLESGPCKAGWRNPSRRHESTGYRAEDVKESDKRVYFRVQQGQALSGMFSQTTKENDASVTRLPGNRVVDRKTLQR